MRAAQGLDLDVLVKMRMAGCTIPEIAAELNVSEKTIDNRLREDVLFRDIYAQPRVLHTAGDATLQPSNRHFSERRNQI